MTNPRKKGGRPRKDLSDEQVAQVEKLAAVLTMDQIANFFGFSEQTLRRRMRESTTVLEAYEKGKARAIAGVATNLMQQARDGNVTAAIFYLKTQAGWKETSSVEHTGRDGGPIETREVTDDELRRRAGQLANRLAALAPAGNRIGNGNGNGNGRHG